MISRQEFPSISELEFEEMVLGSELSVAIYITHKCCRIADSAYREFASAAQQFKDSIGIFIVDVDVEKALVSRLDVKGAPILLVFRAGIERCALLGFYREDELRKRLWSIISTGDKD